MRSLLFTIFISFGFGLTAQNLTLFDEANALYNTGNYNEALTKYKEILESDFHSAELYFNIANAHYKLNHIAPSIFYFEKALQLKPNDKDIKNNLGFAQNMTVDAINKVPDVGFSRLTKNIINITSVDVWALIAVVGMLHFVFLFLLYHFTQATRKKRIAFVVSFVSLFVSGFALLMAFQKSYLDSKENPAIVFAQETRVKTVPNTNGEELFTLHEGTKVQVLENFEDWYRIKLSDNSEGWLRAQAIQLLD